MMTELKDMNTKETSGRKDRQKGNGNKHLRHKQKNGRHLRTRRGFSTTMELNDKVKRSFKIRKERGGIVTGTLPKRRT